MRRRAGSVHQYIACYHQLCGRRLRVQRWKSERIRFVVPSRCYAFIRFRVSCFYHQHSGQLRSHHLFVVRWKTLCDSCELFINIPATDTCNCGSWSPLSVDMIAPDGAITSHPDQSCGAVFNDVAVGTMVNFSAGGYLCSPSNESCVATLFWSMPGATPSSGSGLPIFTINNPGSYTLTLQEPAV